MSMDFYACFCEAKQEWDLHEGDTDCHIGTAKTIDEISKIIAKWVLGRKA
jgi:hypothetical protein